jgi:molybdopterin/thiamine biosynthesis adenylyltransferase
MQLYNRQLILEGWTIEVQEKLRASTVMIIGAGALGSHAAMALCAAGVGHFILFDGDVVEAHNLHRQFHYTQADCGKNKADVLSSKLKALQPDVKISMYSAFWDREANLPQIPDVIVDGSDLFSVKYEIQSYARQHAIPWIYASVLGYKGELAVFMPGTACYNCLYPTPPALAESCDITGVVPMLPAWVAQKQAWETLKVLGAPGRVMEDALWQIHLQQGGEKTFILEKSPECAQYCIANNSPYALQFSPEIKVEQLRKVIQEGAANWHFYDIRPASAYGNVYPGMEYLDPSTYHDTLCQLSPGSQVLIACSKGKNSKQLVNILQPQYPELNLYSLEKGLENISKLI